MPARDWPIMPNVTRTEALRRLLKPVPRKPGLLETKLAWLGCLWRSPAGFPGEDRYRPIPDFPWRRR